MIDDAGPVLDAGEVGRALVDAIRAENRDAVVVDGGSYLRVRVPRRCRLTRSAIERVLGRPFRFPADLELVMPSFKGALTLTAEEAIWEAR